jgi:EpsD family peptidyl-prolyl cis-trans isomerase
MVSGCDQVKKLAGGGKPSGQVVATVDGKEITSLEVRSEMGGFSSRDPKVMKAAQQQALQRIIMRKILADAARKDKLDKGAEYTLQVQRGEETLLAQLYERKLASKTTQPSREQAEAYVASHPDMFAGRKVLFVDQLIAGPNKINPERFRPLKSLPEIKALLDSEGVQYQQNAVVLDTLSADPRLVAGIKSLPPGEVFVIPQGGALLFNQVNDSRSVPFTGEMAVAYATNALRRQQAGDTVSKQITDMRKAIDSKIVYSAAFKPDTSPLNGLKPGATTPPAAAAAPAAAAPPAAPAAAPAAPEKK